MWLYVSNGFLSIVAHRNQSDDLIVRARNPTHITSLFPNAQVVHMPTADYPYRTILRRNFVEETVACYVKNIGYDNFKASIDDFEYHDACIDIWRTMWTYGNRYRNEDD